MAKVRVYKQGSSEKVGLDYLIVQIKEGKFYSGMRMVWFESDEDEEHNQGDIIDVPDSAIEEMPKGE